MAYVCASVDAATSACTSWIDATVDLAALGITPEDSAAVFGVMLGGMLGFWVLGLIVGSVSRLIHNAITGD